MIQPLLERIALRQKVVIYVGLLVILLAGLSGFLSPWRVFAAVVSIVFFILAFFRPRYIISFLMVWLPLEPFILKFVPDQIYLYVRYFSEGLIYFLAITIFARIFIGEKKIKQTPIDLPFVMFLLILVASALINFVPPHIAVLGARQILRFILLFFIVVYLYPTKEYIRRTTVLLLIVVMIEGALGILQAVSGGNLDIFFLPSQTRFFGDMQIFSGVTQFWDPGSRVFATLGRYDLLGTFITFFLLLTLGFMYQSDLLEDRPRLWLVLALGIPALILTYSRSSWFGLLLGLVVIGLFMMRDRRILIGLVAFVFMIIGYLFYSGIVVPRIVEVHGLRQSVAERFLEAFSAERWRGEYYGLGRLYFIVQTPLRVVASSPIFGVGPGQYGGGAAAALGNHAIYDRLGLPFGIYGTEGMIDNNWFSLWGEVGTLGLIIYIWIFFVLFITARKVFRFSSDPITRGLALGFCGAIFAVTLHAFLGTFLEIRTLASYFWIFAGFVTVLGRREKIV